MIKLSELYLHTRLAAGDAIKNRYDDFEIQSAADGAITMLSEACIENFSGLLIRSATVQLKNGEGALPEDFLAMAEAPFAPLPESGSVTGGGYIVRGERIYCGSDGAVADITYHRRPKISGDMLDLPFNLLLSLAELAAVILQKEEGKQERAAELARAMAMSSKRRSMGALPDPVMWEA